MAERVFKINCLRMGDQCQKQASNVRHSRLAVLDFGKLP